MWEMKKLYISTLCWFNKEEQEKLLCSLGKYKNKSNENLNIKDIEEIF
jgi:hypothetical protein